jgi:curved DNA-binding protein
MDYYSILGVPKNATQEQIRKAYKKQSMQHHPDRGGNEEQFKKVNEAYQTLSDAQKRAAYDNPQPQYSFNSADFGFGGFPPDFENLFRQQRHPARNRDINITIKLQLEDVLTVQQKTIRYKSPDGKDNLVDVEIPAGVAHGQIIRYRGLGDHSYKQLPPGNLLITIYVLPNKKFRRSDKDLHTNLTISSLDAIVGTTVEINTLSGKNLALYIPAGIKNNTKLRVTGEGIQGGSLFVAIELQTPKLTDAQIERIKEIRDEIS